MSACLRRFISRDTINKSLESSTPLLWAARSSFGDAMMVSLDNAGKSMSRRLQPRKRSHPGSTAYCTGCVSIGSASKCRLIVCLTSSALDRSSLTSAAPLSRAAICLQQILQTCTSHQEQPQFDSVISLKVQHTESSERREDNNGPVLLLVLNKEVPLACFWTRKLG